MIKNAYLPLVAFFCLAFLGIFNDVTAHAQGCVAVRQMGGVTTMCSSNSYNIPKGNFQVGASYRYFHSWRHFIGKTEQPHRQTTGGGRGPDGKERGNAVNIYSHALDFNVSYGLTDRIQLNASVPFVHNERSQVLRSATDTMRYSVYAKGLGDIRVSAGYWLFNPATAHTGNLMLGLGIKTNSGSHTVKDEAPQADGSRKLVYMDQAIQPGDGGVGFSVEVQGFRQLHQGIYGFLNGYYLFNPRESNGTARNAPTPGLEGYEIYASPDQYFGRAGVMTSFGKADNITFSLAGRLEGIPAYDVFGGQVAYRRPGYVVAVEPGLSYRNGRHNVSVFVPYNFIKNRIRSAADIARTNLENSHTTDENKKVRHHGDAAFADYSISINYSYRLGKLW